MNWTDFKLIAAITVGLIVSVLLSTANTWRARFLCVMAGVFFAVFLSEPLVQWAGLELSMWQYAVAGLLAMSGDRLARRIVSLVDTAKTPWEGGFK